MSKYIKIRLTHKYIRDSKINNINELIEIINNNESIFFCYSLRNSSWVLNQQFNLIIRWLKDGCFYRVKPAISRTINKGIYPTNDPADNFINLLIIKDIEKPVGIKFDELPYLREVHIVKSNDYELNHNYINSVIKQCKKHNITILLDYYECEEKEE